jgi:hypothetical protein
MMADQMYMRVSSRFRSDSRPSRSISLDSHWVNIEPQLNWLGTCSATIQVSDSLMTNVDTFQVNIVPIESTIYLPIINK